MASSGGGGNNGGGGDERLREALLAPAGDGNGNGGKVGEGNLEEIRSVRAFLRHAAEENRRLWYLAGPAIFTSIAQYSLGAVTLVFAGHLTTLELDAVSTENNVIAGLALGITVRLILRASRCMLRLILGVVINAVNACRKKYWTSWSSQRNEISNLEQASHIHKDHTFSS
jgi:hypothetical protein